MDIIQKQTDIDCEALSNLILKKEPEIIKKYPPTGFNGEYTDGQTQLGSNSLTSRFYHFNVLSWDGTDLVKKTIRSGYEAYTGLIDTPIYVKCWANVMRKGDQIKPHLHDIGPTCYLGGHICVQCDDTSTHYINPINQINDPMTYESKNDVGKVSIFPNNIPHYTDIQKSDKERITIAFDLMIENPNKDNYIRLI